MTDPNFTVVPEALRDEATVWEEQADVLGDARSAATPLELNGWQAGLFFLMVGDYMDVVSQIETLTSAGRTEFDAIGEALRTNATNYEASDIAAGGEFPHVEDGF